MGSPFRFSFARLLTGTLLLTFTEAACGQEAPAFTGRALLVLSDTSMPASGFVDGKLVRSARDRVNAADTLSVLSLPIRPAGKLDENVNIAEVPVSNSVVGPPFQVTASPDGRFAYVLETRGNAPDGVESVPNVFQGLSSESHVTVVDLQDRTAPKIVESVVVAHHTHTIDLSPNGRMLAVNTYEPGRHIVLRRISADGTIGPEATAFGIEVGGRPLRRVGRVQWHPSGNFLALTLPFEDEIRFYRVSESQGQVRLEQWGNAAKTGDFPDQGAFSPDGQYFVTTNLHWGDAPPPNYLNPPPGSLTAVRFDRENARHAVTGTAAASVSPEGIAFSPNGRFIVTAALTRSFMPWSDDRLTAGGALDLLSLDPRTGRMDQIANYPLQGILTEGLAFDASGNFVAVTHFDRYEPRRRRGVVEFWRLVDEGIPRLERTNYELDVVPGPHTLHLIP
ncbi:beta-propeller fold lactonase family protein [Bradyrhizobium sp. LHD-71]|uniref:beta-propeller fold lactonase family protein n=1 Tax=Bradyrhizobium sp. LHD-71 TaxID=3072141 RepID=UPI00280D9391|nr:beta-propeller fold lactonase family protein [Bradyrhizobium sp. LHD-71]MDQ8728149.1 beta-propeller fold lactonase family protein [Bradyrhizobium sp. LHD-71]